MAPAPARKPTPETSTPTQPGEVTPTGTGTDQAATQTGPEQAKDVNPETTSESLLTETQAHPERTFHDALSGRPVNAGGYFTDGVGLKDEGPIPEHRIVANDWADKQVHAHDPQAEADRDEDTQVL